MHEGHVSDKSLNSLSKLKYLTYLNLAETKVTDRGLRFSGSKPSKKFIYGVWETEDGIAFAQELPEAKIIF